MKTIKSITIVLLLTTFYTASTFAQAEKSEVGVSIGMVTGGEYYVEESDRFFEIRSGLMLHGFYDYYVAEKLAIGFFGSLSMPELGFLEETVSFTEFGFTLKPRFFLSDDITLKPGLNVGYRMINSDSIDLVGGKMQGLGLNLTTEWQLHIFDGFTPFVDLGFTTQPLGGNDDFTVTFSPVFNARLGIVFL